MNIWQFTIGLLLIGSSALAGPVVVRDSSDPPFDPWQLKRELMQQQAWAEALRQQAALEWLETLPLWCTRVSGGSYGDYECNGLYYRPLQQEGQRGYLRIDPPPSALQPAP